MAIWNEKYYKGTDVYSDGSIEDDILEIVCREDYRENKDVFIRDNYVLAYHLSAVRENILNWYPFKASESAIEIGAGCGAITGMLCRKLGKVVSVDLSKRRSKINYERHKDFDNLEIIIGNFNDIELEEQYDYVVLNGVFEYAISFTEAEKPYHEFLNHISRFLKPDGKFLISIENKLGLKYFNGAKEDHTGNYFLGLNNYRGNESVRTFSKTELAEILMDEGFKYQKFYYPYPDYKFPNEVFTDDSIDSNQYGRPVTNIETDRYHLFDEYAVSKTLIKENIRDIFANSFLLETSRESFESDVIYAKLNVERKKEFQIGTSILKDENGKRVVKYAIHPDADAHISKICDTTKLDGKKVKYLPAKKQGDKIVFEFLQEKNLDAVINGYIIEKDVDAIYATVEEFFQTYLEEISQTQMMDTYHNEMFCTYFGDAKTEKTFLCIKHANIDIIMDNVYLKNDVYVLIDGEWIYPEWIPYEFLKWRAINELYGKHEELSQLIANAKMLERNGVEVEDEELFRSWTLHFAEMYVGSVYRSRWAKPVKYISLDALHQEMRLQQMTTIGLYVDTGNGFSEDEKLSQTIEIKDGRFKVEFHSKLLAKAKKLRLDPVEGLGCIAKLEGLTDGLRLMGNNALEETKAGFVFVDRDPQFYVDVDVPNERVSFEGILQILSKDELITYLQEINEKLIREKNRSITRRVMRKISNTFKK